LTAVIVGAAIAAAGGGSGAEPEPAALELLATTQTGRDMLHKALGPAATTYFIASHINNKLIGDGKNILILLR